MRNKSDRIILVEVVDERTTIFFIISLSCNLGPTSPAHVLKTAKPLKSDNRLMVFLNFSFSDIRLPE